MLVLLGVVELDVTVAALGEVHRDVGALHQHLARRAVVRVHRDAGARLDLEVELVDAERILERDADPRRDRERLTFAGDVGEQHGELVAAEPGDDAALRQHLLDARADHAQQRVAGLVPERVVDLLEPVEVDQQHGGAAAARSLLLREATLEGVGEVEPVRAGR